MLQKKHLIGLVGGAALMLATSAVFAQDMEPLVDGLNFPRSISFDADGNLYIAEAGVGGDISVIMLESEATAGTTAAVVMVAPDGTRTNLIPNLPSIASAAEAAGVASIVVTDTSYWVLTAAGAPMFPLAGTLMEIDRETFRLTTLVDLRANEVENNPDGNEIDSNPNDLELADDGTLYIVDTGANTLYTWTEEAGLEIFNVWSDNPVPTSVDVTADGDVYVGFLGAGLAPGAGKVEHWSADGELVETFGGMTTVTDVMVADDGAVWVVQLITAFGEQGPVMDSGAVGTVSADGFVPVAEGLVLPYELALSPDGQLYVTTNAAFGAPGSGTVIAVGGM